MTVTVVPRSKAFQLQFEPLPPLPHETADNESLHEAERVLKTTITATTEKRNEASNNAPLSKRPCLEHADALMMSLFDDLLPLSNPLLPDPNANARQPAPTTFTALHRRAGVLRDAGGVKAWMQRFELTAHECTSG